MHPGKERAIRYLIDIADLSLTDGAELTAAIINQQEQTTMSNQSVQVTVTAEAVAAIPDSALGIGSMVVLTGETPDGQTVHFKASGSHVAVAKRNAGPYIVDLEPHEILKPWEE